MYTLTTVLANQNGRLEQLVRENSNSNEHSNLLKKPAEISDLKFFFRLSISCLMFPWSIIPTF